MTITKTEFLCVRPKTSKAKNRFANEMDLLHSCRVEKRDGNRVFLASISGKYFFWMNHPMTIGRLLNEGSEQH
jgi:hypothetical protein